MVSPRVEVRAELYDYARARSGIADEEWGNKFPRFELWRSGESKPTLKQLEDFARRAHTPIGLMFLPEPPDEPLPIADFRTPENRSARPTADLLDIIYVAQARQEWYRDHQVLYNEEPLEWVGSASTDIAPNAAARILHDLLAWGPQERNKCRTWDLALASLRDAVENAGVLVMIAGHVGTNTRRTLDPAQFQGFALSDPYAPVIFVNGKDRKSAQIFTLAHELAHLLLGSTGLSDLAPRSDVAIEQWCNRSAAEFLVPADEFDEMRQGAGPDAETLDRLARHFKVSTLMLLGRFRELGHFEWDRYFQLRAAERARIAAMPKAPKSGGDTLRTRPVQASKRFTAELLASVYEGSTSFTEAFRLVGVRSEPSLRKIATNLGVL